MSTVYYAHCLAIYGSEQEKRDLFTLREMGFTVINPADQIHKDAIANMPNSEAKMEYFINLVRNSTFVGFRSLPHGKIPAGVAKEIKAAMDCAIPVFELPSMPVSRFMSVEETREYLRDIGQR